jgi:hypothetical protein
MRPPRSSLAVIAALGAAVAGLPFATGASAAGPPSLGPCPMLPADNVWNTDVSGLPVHPRSDAWIASSGGTGRLIHPDWGPSGGSVAYGIPWQMVDASHQKVNVAFTYASESDPGPYPLGNDTPIEGGAGSTGDRHALVVDSSTCRLYETYDTHYADGGASQAGSGAVFDLGSNALRPATWTSADAAGLPILPGLVRYAEMRAGAIRHAIRFTVQRTDRSFLWPARHQAGAAFDSSLPPMGARFRMKAGADTSHFSADAQVILTAMKQYGLIVADNGSNWYFQGDTDPGWSSGVLSELKTVPAGDFEAVDESSLMVDPNSGQARQGAAAAPTPTPIVLQVPPPPPTTPPTPAPAETPAPTPELSPSPAATPTPPGGDVVALVPSPQPETSPGGNQASLRAAGAVVTAAASGGLSGVAVAALAAGGLAVAGAGAGLLRRRGRRRRR